MEKTAKKKAGQSGSKAAKTAILQPNVDQQHWWDHLDMLLRSRQIAAGIDLLNEKEPQWNSLQSADRAASDVLLTLAQWVDVGYRDAQFLRRMLDLLPSEDRLKLGVSAYVRVRMAEAFHALAIDDVDGTIRTLDIVLRLDRELLDSDLKTLAHLWKGRAHRRNADYEKALEHIEAALALASTLPDSETISAILKVQQGWLVFQRGDIGGALHLFDEAEEVLQQTDHWIALGNIESARGRIIRRKGDYVKALHHFDRAVSFYEKRQPHHPNLARAVTNRAFVKRLLALQLQKHIDSSVSRRISTGLRKGSEGARLRPLHKQYQDLYRSAIDELERAKEICILHEHHSGLAAALLNAGHLHLDVGDLDLAEREAGEANAIAERLNSAVLKVRAHILIGLIENSHVEELLGNPEDVPSFARRAKQHCMNAVSLAQGTQNKRLLLNAHLALGEVAANNFFHDYDLARRCLDSASALIETEDADYVVDELNALRTKLLKTVGIDDTLRAWSQGIVTGKSLQEVMEEFAQLVVTQIWLREGRRISRVAKQLSMSPKKVRRLVKHDRFL
jgi:tetratricopeptide (TPR) repeat protein